MVKKYWKIWIRLKITNIYTVTCFFEKFVRIITICNNLIINLKIAYYWSSADFRQLSLSEGGGVCLWEWWLQKKTFPLLKWKKCMGSFLIVFEKYMCKQHLHKKPLLKLWCKYLTSLLMVYSYHTDSSFNQDILKTDLFF